MKNRLRHFIVAFAALGPIVPAHAQNIEVHKFSRGTEPSEKVRQLRAMRVPFAPTRALREGTHLPTSVDNSVLKYFPPVIDQQGGSCAQAAGIGYMFTYEMNRLLNRDAKATTGNRFSYQFAWNMLNGGADEGGFVEEGLNMARQYGMMTLRDYGTSGTYEFRWASGYDKYLTALGYRAGEILVFDDSIPLMKRYLYDAGDGSAEGGILTFSGQSSWTIDNAYAGPSETGYRSLLTKLGTSGAHAVTIAGYDDLVTYTDAAGKTHTGAFIVVNTWGTHSHDNGRFYLPYDFFRDSTVSPVQLSNNVVAVRVTEHRPLAVLKLTVNYTSRDDLYFRVGVANDPEATAPRQFYTCPIFNQQGGDYPMQGQYAGSEMELALDATPYLKSTDSPAGEKFFVDVVRGFGGRKKGTGSILKLSLIDYRGSNGGSGKEYVYAGTLPLVLQDGSNRLAIQTRQPVHTSASPCCYTTPQGNVSSETFLLKTASGHSAKVRFANPDKTNHTIDIRYKVTKK